MLQNGDVIGGMYQIVREIGAGGTGVIYLGYHLRLQKYIVVKKIKDTYTQRVNIRAEADILKSLHHTYLPQVYDFLTVGSGIYTVMEYIGGHDMQYYLEKNGRFEEKTLWLWLNQLCEVLQYLHGQMPPILHSDIKPANIMITPQGNICLIDFNISLDGKQTKEVQGLSQYYAAPEQYKSAQQRINVTAGRRVVLDGRMDIYSLGAVFYHLMTGQYPNPERGVPLPIMQMDIPYSPGIKHVVAKAVEFNPSRRFQNAGLMLRALKNTSKYDPKYRMWSRLQYIGIFTYGLFWIMGGLLLYSGWGIFQKESWQTAYHTLYEASEAGDEKKTAEAGMKILNSYGLRGYMKRNPGKKAEILHTLGDSYFSKEEYQQAAEYYKEALEQSAEILFLRDYMIARARSGQQTDIYVLSSKYPQIDIQNEEIRLVEAEILFSQNKKEEALIKIEELLSVSKNMELTARLYELKAVIYKSEGNTLEVLKAIDNVVQSNPDIRLMRKAGQLAYEVGEAASSNTGQQTCNEKAFQIYSILNQKASPSYEDKLNYALVGRAQGKYEDSIRSLKELKSEYPHDYHILMWLSYNYLDLAMSDEEDKKIREELNYYYHSGCYEYQKSGEKNSDMEMLKEIMKEME